MMYYLAEYDRLQILETKDTGSTFVDFMTLRGEEDAHDAVELVDGGTWEGKRAVFRIVSQRGHGSKLKYASDALRPALGFFLAMTAAGWELVATDCGQAFRRPVPGNPVFGECDGFALIRGLGTTDAPTSFNDLCQVHLYADNLPLTAKVGVLNVSVDFAHKVAANARIEDNF